MSAARTLDVLSFGEALVDFLPERRGVPLRQVARFERVAGGAPANVATGLARLGVGVGLLTKLGADEFGHFLRDALAAEGVDVAAVELTREAKTGITFVSVSHTGERSFLFFREPSAELTLRVEDLDPAWWQRADVFAYGSNLLTRQPSRDATGAAIAGAQASGSLLVCDPNLRLHLWPGGRKEAVPVVLEALRGAHLVKVNEEEMSLLAPDAGDIAEVYRRVFGPLGVRGLVCTRGAEGAELVWDGAPMLSVAAPEVEVVDTTGAGDGFLAGLLWGLVREARARGCTGMGAAGYVPMLEAFRQEDWHRVLALGCEVGSRVCERFGATPSLPRLEDLRSASSTPPRQPA